MSATEIALRLFGLIILIGLNAFFVMTEFALTRVRQHDPSEFDDDGPLRRAWDMTERLEIYLTGCQVGITFTSILLGVVAEPAVSWILRPAIEVFGVGPGVVEAVSVTVAVVLIQVIHTVWGEQSPTYLGVERPKSVLRVTALAHKWFTRLAYPFIKVGDILAKWTLRRFDIELSRSWIEEPKNTSGAPDEEIPSMADVRRRMGEVLRRGPVDDEDRQEVLAAFDIHSTPVRDIMVGRDDVISLSTEWSRDENLQVLRSNALVRFPLIRSTLDDVVGILYTPRLLADWESLVSGERTFEELAVDPLLVPGDADIGDVVDRMQDASQEIAIVCDGDRAVGVVTATDALEAIAGELRDPFDSVAPEGPS